MLVSLHAKNFAIIDEIEVYFGEKLNIISGETGAGKSVIIGSINAALGGRMTKEMIRTGSDYALAELVFQTESEAVARRMEELELPMTDGELLITRKLMANGRSVLRINGETVTSAAVKELAGLLIDIHGQHEHQSLLKKSAHLQMIDRFAGEKLAALKEQTRIVYEKYRKEREEREAALCDEDTRLRELSFARFEWQEITDAHLVAGEEEELRQEYRRLSNANAIEAALGEVYRLTCDGDASVAEQLGYALRQMAKIEGLDEPLSQMSEALTQVEDCVNDFNHELRDYMNRTENTQERFAEVEARLDTVNRLTAKYGSDIAAVLAYAEGCSEKIARLEDYDQYLQKLEKEYAQAEAELRGLCEQMSLIRKKSARQLTEQLTEALRDLNFLDVKLQIEFKTLEHYTANGNDEAEFLISTNPGEPVQPLSRIASGGELSRIMLAMKSVFAGKDDIETMIFDEIDVGVSGRTAQMVSEKMAGIAVSHQLLCITHLPQIAAMADTHFVIEKTTDGIATTTGIRQLDRAGETEEIARMLGGVTITDKVLESAGEMKQLAEQKKEALGRKTENC